MYIKRNGKTHQEWVFRGEEKVIRRRAPLIFYILTQTAPFCAFKTVDFNEVNTHQIYISAFLAAQVLNQFRSMAGEKCMKRAFRDFYRGAGAEREKIAGTIETCGKLQPELLHSSFITVLSSSRLENSPLSLVFPFYRLSESGKCWLWAGRGFEHDSLDFSLKRNGFQQTLKLAFLCLFSVSFACSRSI